MTKKRNSYARFSKEEVLENIEIVEKNIENTRLVGHQNLI